MKRSLFRLMAVMICCLLVGACAGFPGFKTKKQSPPPQNAPLYYDFGDVLIPKELKIDRSSSFIYQTTGLAVGVMVLNGRVEMGSLISFFENNMAKDNWRLISSFKSPRTILLFEKENRWCVINITEHQWTLEVEIWVAPTQGGENGLLK